MASTRSASLNGGLEAEPPAGSRGRVPGGGSGGELSLPEAESFLYIFIQEVAKSVKDVGENLPTCLELCYVSRAAMTSPKFLPMGGGGRLVRP